MSTHNICFHGEIIKILCRYPFLSGTMTDVFFFTSSECMNKVQFLFVCVYCCTVFTQSIWMA